MIQYLRFLNCYNFGEIKYMLGNIEFSDITILQYEKIGYWTLCS